MSHFSGKRRGAMQLALDAALFPIRALCRFHEDRWGLSSLATERFDYVSGEVIGRCLDVGCGYHNRFVTQFLGGNGIGIDVLPYEGLSAENIVDDPCDLPFDDATFESVTFIANINHIPEQDRDAELVEAFRVLKPNGNIIVTMGNPVAEVLVHKLVYLYDRLFRTKYDMDSERGMDADEAYYLTDREIASRLKRAGFHRVRKKYFATQWALNHLFVAWKPGTPESEAAAPLQLTGGCDE